MAGSLEGISVNVTFEIQGWFESTVPIVYNSVVVGPGNELEVPISYRILSDTDGDGDMEPVPGPNGLLAGTVTLDISGNQVFAKFEGTAQPAGFLIKIAGLSPSGVAPGTIAENGEFTGVNTIYDPTYNASTKELTLNWFFNGFQPGTVVSQTVFYDNQLNDAPQAVDDLYTATAGGAWTSKNVLANDIDLDNGGPFVVDINTVTAINGSSTGIGAWVDLAGGGQVRLQTNGALQFRDDGDFKDLAAGETRATTFNYTVTDSANLSDNADVTITVTGVNDAPTAINLTNQIALAENTSVQTKVADLTVIDPDATGNNNVLTVSDNRFEIGSNALYLKAGQSLDFETEPAINLTVTSTDGSLTFDQAVTVEITDVNEAPTAITVTASAGATIAENVAVETGIKVADIAVTDDALGTNVLGLSGADAGSFEVRGNELFFTGASPDFETQASYSVSVTVDDADVGSSPDLTSIPIVLTVEDLDEVPPPLPVLQLATDTGASATDGITQVGTINVGQLEPGATWAYSTDAGATWTPGVGTSFTLAPGTYAVDAVKVRQTDAADNTSTSSYPSAITVDVAAPAFASASVNGVTLVLTYGETLDAVNVPAPGAFAVTVGGNAVSVSAVAVNASAKTVQLTLGTAVANGQAVTVAYADPSANDDANAIQDLAGNDVALLAAFAATNNTLAPPPPPPVTPPVTSTPNPDGSTTITLTQPSTPTELSQFATSGVDNVSSPFSVVLPDGIENVTLTGNSNIDATGNNGANTIIGNAGSNVLTGDAPPAAFMSSAFTLSGSSAVVLGGADTIAAGEGNDIVFGNAGNDVLFGNQGNDTLYGGKDDDFVYGGKGDDYIEGNLGNDYIEGNLGNDLVLGNQGNDTVLGNQGNDTVHGGQGDDLVHGGQGDDFVFGDRGNDRICGDLGNDTLTGGEGTDTFFFALNSGSDVIADFNRSEGDRLDFQGQSFTVTDVNGSAVFMLSGGGTITLTGVSSASLDAGVFA